MTRTSAELSGSSTCRTNLVTVAVAPRPSTCKALRVVTFGGWKGLKGNRREERLRGRTCFEYFL